VLLRPPPAWALCQRFADPSFHPSSWAATTTHYSMSPPSACLARVIKHVGVANTKMQGPGKGCLASWQSSWVQLEHKENMETWTGWKGSRAVVAWWTGGPAIDWGTPPSSPFRGWPDSCGVEGFMFLILGNMHAPCSRTKRLREMAPNSAEGAWYAPPTSNQKPPATHHLPHLKLREYTQPLSPFRPFSAAVRRA